MLTFPSPPQAIPGPRGEAVDQHRWQNHGHHGQGPEAPPPLRAGRCANPHLHAHEEGRWGGVFADDPPGQGSPFLPGDLENSSEVGKREMTWLWLCWCRHAEQPALSSICPPGWNLLEPRARCLVTPGCGCCVCCNGPLMLL